MILPLIALSLEACGLFSSSDMLQAPQIQKPAPDHIEPGTSVINLADFDAINSIDKANVSVPINQVCGDMEPILSADEYIAKMNSGQMAQIPLIHYENIDPEVRVKLGIRPEFGYEIVSGGCFQARHSKILPKPIAIENQFIGQCLIQHGLYEYYPDIEQTRLIRHGDLKTSQHMCSLLDQALFDPELTEGQKSKLVDDYKFYLFMLQASHIAPKNVETVTDSKEGQDLLKLLEGKNLEEAADLLLKMQANGELAGLSADDTSDNPTDSN